MIFADCILLLLYLYNYICKAISPWSLFKKGFYLPRKNMANIKTSTRNDLIFTETEKKMYSSKFLELVEKQIKYPLVHRVLLHWLLNLRERFHFQCVKWTSALLYCQRIRFVQIALIKSTHFTAPFV